MKNVHWTFGGFRCKIGIDFLEIFGWRTTRDLIIAVIADVSISTQAKGS